MIGAVICAVKATNPKPGIPKITGRILKFRMESASLGLFFDKCASEYECGEDMLLIVVNSIGVCKYTDIPD